MIKNELSRLVSVENIDKKGHSMTVTATAEECAALATRFGLQNIDHLTGTITITPHTARFHVTGVLDAAVQQISVVSGDPVPTIIRHDIDAWFTDHTKIASFEQERQRRDTAQDDKEIKDEQDDPEQIINGMIDVGEVCAQFLGLALDDFPRGADESYGDHIEKDEQDNKPNPFAALAAIKDKQ